MNSNPPRPSKLSVCVFLCTLLILSAIPRNAFAQVLESISIKEYSTKAIKVTNPVDITRLSRDKTFQINTEQYILQFFFSGKNILGMIFKRNPDFPVVLRWCFFRDCEESSYDYTVVIAQAFQPPFSSGFFEVKFPPGLQYQFQGLHFTY